MINKERVKQSFLEMAAINSPSKHERALVDYIKPKLVELGFDVEEDDAGERIGGNAGNIIASKKGTIPGAKAVFLGAHTDTVEPTEKINVIIDGDIICTDGNTILGADDKGGIAAILEGVRSINEDGKAHGDIQIIFNISEEIGLMGAYAIDNSKIKAEYGFILDNQRPTGGITWSAPSQCNILVEITGKASHAGMSPEKGVSAILAASNAISKMKLGRIDEETTANIGIIEGGKARNIVPDKVMIKAEARSRDESKLAAQVEHMKSVFEKEAEKIGARADVTVKQEYSAFRFTENDEIVKLAAEAIKRIGLAPVFWDGGGGSDANVYNKAGIPVLVMGVGYEDAHSSSERMLISELVKSSEFVAALIETAAEG